MDPNESNSSRYNTPTASLFSVEPRLPQAPIRGQPGRNFESDSTPVLDRISESNSQELVTNSLELSGSQSSRTTNSNLQPSRSTKIGGSLSFTNQTSDSQNRGDLVQRYLDEISISMKAENFAEKQEEEEYQKYIKSCLKDVDNLKFTKWQLPNFHDLPNLVHKF